MVDAYKVYWDLFNIKLDEYFCEFELHEYTNLDLHEKPIALVVGKSDEIKPKPKTKPKPKLEFE